MKYYTGFCPCVDFIFVISGLIDIQSFLLDTYGSLTSLHILGKGVQVTDLYVDAAVYRIDSWLKLTNEDNANTEKVSDYKQMLSDAFRNVYLIGSPGRGKTTFCLRLVQTWANALEKQKSKLELSDDESYLAERFDLVLFVRLRTTDKNNIQDMLQAELFQENPRLLPYVENYISEHPKKVLIILDGLDEWQPYREQLLPKRSGLNNCLILITTRHSVLDALKADANDQLFEIRELNELNVRDLAKNVLEYVYHANQPLDKAIAFVSALRKRKLHLVTEVPIVLTFLVGLWFENKEFGDSKTTVYCHLLNFLLRVSEHSKSYQFSRSRQTQLPLYDDYPFIDLHYELIVDVGAFAYNCLLNDAVSTSFSKLSLVGYFGDERTTVCLVSGLLTILPQPSVRDPSKVQVVFFHRTIQDFLAAFFIASEICHKKDDGLNKLLQYASTVDKMLKLGNVFTFLSGLVSEKSHNISSHLAATTSKSMHVENFRQSLSERYPFSHKVHLYKKIKAIQNLQLLCYVESAYNRKESVQTSSHMINVLFGIIFEHGSPPENFVMHDIVMVDKIDKYLKTLLAQNTTSLKSVYIDLPNRLETEEVEDLILKTTSLVRLRLDRSTSEIIYRFCPKH